MKKILNFVEKYRNTIFIIIFLQALLATLGSLFYSTYGDPVLNLTKNGTIFGDGLVPCTLCWFARILTYPVVFIAFVGILKKDKRFTDYLLPMTMLGIALEVYHYSIQKLPVETNFVCSSANPCDALQVDYFGFVTIPFLCLIAFIVMTIFSFLNSYQVRTNSERINFLKVVAIYTMVCILFGVWLFL